MAKHTGVLWVGLSHLTPEEAQRLMQAMREQMASE
jgi:hypothetical protein